MKTWNWIPPSVVYAVHDKQLAEHGGAPGIKDDNLIHSALARPEQLASYGHPPPDVADLAAAYAFGIARNHKFCDGNKRTAWILARLFLAANGRALKFNQAEAYAAVMALASGSMSESDFARWLRERLC